MKDVFLNKYGSMSSKSSCDLSPNLLSYVYFRRDIRCEIKFTSSYSIFFIHVKCILRYYCALLFIKKNKIKFGDNDMTVLF